MQSFLSLAKSRYSVRSYLPTPVEQEKLDYILECGRIAPSAANYQPWHIVAIRDEERKKTIATTYDRKWFSEAPVILVFCGDHSKGWKRADGKDHTDIDLSIIVDHITLAAAEQGLGTCWICNFDAKKCTEILQLPDHLEPVVLLPVGYPLNIPDDGSRHLVRKTTNEIIHWEKF
jgi:nitroreductase